jgi:hypothetical protein
VSQWEHEQVSKYPEIKIFIDKLKSNICKRPESGFPDPLLSIAGKTIPYHKLSINISLFPYKNAVGYNFITASYIHNENTIYIAKMAFS